MRALPGKLVFDLVDRYGLPLEFIMEKCKSEELVVDIFMFTKIALSKNWNKPRLLIRIKEAYVDVYGETYAAHVITRLEELV